MLLFCLKFEFNGLVFRVSLIPGGVFLITIGLGRSSCLLGVHAKTLIFIYKGVPFRKNFITSSSVLLALPTFCYWLIGLLIDYAQFGILRV